MSSCHVSWDPFSLTCLLTVRSKRDKIFFKWHSPFTNKCYLMQNWVPSVLDSRDKFWINGEIKVFKAVPAAKLITRGKCILVNKDGNVIFGNDFNFIILGWVIKAITVSEVFACYQVKENVQAKSKLLMIQKVRIENICQGPLLDTDYPGRGK